LAQTNVYSVNVVGYINVTLQPGYNLVSSPLQASNNSVNTVLANISPVDPANSLLFTWGGVSYNQGQIAGGDGFWYDPNTGNPSTQVVPPGASFFIQNGSGGNLTMTLTGSVVQGTNGYVVSKGYTFLGDPAPISGDIVTNGFPVTDNALLYTWNPVSQQYNQALLGGGPPSPGFFDPNTGNPVVVAPAVGQGFIYFSPLTNNTTWTRSFIVQ